MDVPRVSLSIRRVYVLLSSFDADCAFSLVSGFARKKNTQVINYKRPLLEDLERAIFFYLVKRLSSVLSRNDGPAGRDIGG